MHMHICETGANNTMLVENGRDNGNAIMQWKQIALNDFAPGNEYIALAEPTLPVECHAFKQAVQSGVPPC